MPGAASPPIASQPDTEPQGGLSTTWPSAAAGQQIRAAPRTVTPRREKPGDGQCAQKACIDPHPGGAPLSQSVGSAPQAPCGTAGRVAEDQTSPRQASANAVGSPRPSPGRRTGAWPSVRNRSALSPSGTRRPDARVQSPTRHAGAGDERKSRQSQTPWPTAQRWVSPSTLRALAGPSRSDTTEKLPGTPDSSPTAPPSPLADTRLESKASQATVLTDQTLPEPVSEDAAPRHLEAWPEPPPPRRARTPRCSEERSHAAQDVTAFAGQCEVVSLGTWCAVSYALRSMNLQRHACPFDWVRSPLHGVIQCIEDGFESFLSYTFATPIDQHGGLVFGDTTWGGSFWQHDLKSPEVQEQFQRRIDRFYGRREVSPTTPRIFVRAVNSSDELKDIWRLYNTLRHAFSGARVMLLVLVDLQCKTGLLRINGEGEEVLFYRVHKDVFGSDAREWDVEKQSLAYAEGVGLALRVWAGDVDVRLKTVPGLSEVQRKIDPFDGGNTGRELFNPKRPGSRRASRPRDASARRGREASGARRPHRWGAEPNQVKGMLGPPADCAVPPTPLSIRPTTKAIMDEPAAGRPPTPFSSVQVSAPQWAGDVAPEAEEYDEPTLAPPSPSDVSYISYIEPEVKAREQSSDWTVTPSCLAGDASLVQSQGQAGAAPPLLSELEPQGALPLMNHAWCEHPPPLDGASGDWMPRAAQAEPLSPVPSLAPARGVHEHEHNPPPRQPPLPEPTPATPPQAAASARSPPLPLPATLVLVQEQPLDDDIAPSNPTQAPRSTRSEGGWAAPDPPLALSRRHAIFASPAPSDKQGVEQSTEWSTSSGLQGSAGSGSGNTGGVIDGGAHVDAADDSEMVGDPPGIGTLPGEWWQCLRCSFPNELTRHFCEMCESVRHGSFDSSNGGASLSMADLSHCSPGSGADSSSPRAAPSAGSSPRVHSPAGAGSNSHDIQAAVAHAAASAAAPAPDGDVADVLEETLARGRSARRALLARDSNCVRKLPPRKLEVGDLRARLSDLRLGTEEDNKPMDISDLRRRMLDRLCETRPVPAQTADLHEFRRKMIGMLHETHAPGEGATESANDEQPIMGADCEIQGPHSWRWPRARTAMASA